MGPPQAGNGTLHATMLAYLTTDARLPSRKLQSLLNAATDASFNAVTVDDHTSTNDTAAILASGLGAAIDSPRRLASFHQALDEVCQSLAYQIAADGEGATKVVKIVVSAAASIADARAIARAIANSPLVKCAMNGNDPNWGRIVSAAGLCGAKFDPDRAVLKLQGTPVFRHGTPVKFDVDRASKSLAAKEVVVDLSCGIGKHAATVWTCDLSKEYVTINADYHT
jgi:glutamate N-acetyltransferase/amino-acid N-acetyltransferase